MPLVGGACESVIQSFKTAETFRGLGLSPLTQRSMDEEFRYETMSIVQAKCIPTALAGKDIVAKAKTGTGKTIAFLIPVVERILAKRSTLPPAPNAVKPVRALVISPTRELAQQIEDEARRLGKVRNSAAAASASVARSRSSRRRRPSSRCTVLQRGDFFCV